MESMTDFMAQSMSLEAALEITALHYEFRQRMRDRQLMTFEQIVTHITYDNWNDRRTYQLPDRKYYS